MTKDKALLDLWTALARKVLSSILVDKGAIFACYDTLNARLEYFPRQERPIFEAVLGCVSANVPPTVEAVIARLIGSDIPPAFVQTIANQFNDDDNQCLKYNAEQLRDVGALMELKRLGAELSDLGQVSDVRQEVDKVSSRLGSIMAGAAGRDPSAAAVHKVLFERITKGVECVPTGFKWFDDITGGLWPGMNYWINAAYKRGKTTVMRNAVLKSGSLNVPVGVFCAEGSRELFALDCIAMLATELLLDAGYRDADLRIDGMFIRRFYAENGMIKKHEYTAINQAREIWETYPVYLWDNVDTITNLTTFKYLIKKARVEYGVKSVWADYDGLFGDDGTEYERSSETAKTVQRTASIENIAICMLSQQNEEHIRSKGSYSAGHKGGGTAPAAADFWLVPEIDQEMRHILHLTLKFSRHSRLGNYDHFIIPASGLIADKWKVGI